MPGTGDLDSWTAGYQSRDLQRDAPVRLGACVTFVAFGVLGVFWPLAAVPLSGWWLVPVSLGVGIAAARVASRVARKKDEIRVTREQLERKARKDAEMSAFLAAKSETDLTKDGAL